MTKYLPLVIVPLALILWGLLGATQLTAASFHAFVDYQTPYVDNLAPGNEDAPLTSQVVLVVADGLRLDQSQQMASLNSLRARGADRVMRVGLPSLSLPGWSVIGTGAWQEQNGQSTNFDPKPSPLDSIFLAARRKGLSTALTGSPDWGILFKDQIDTTALEPDPPDAHHHPDQVRQQDDAIEADALRLLNDKKPALLLVHFTGPDNAYHGYGVNSPQGERARQDLDARLARLLQAIDLRTTTILVTSDHGHIDRGGHGGAEPAVLDVEFVAAGRGITPGQYGLAQQADIAPTLAVLLGTSFPVDSQGDVLLDMLDATPALKAHRALDWARQSVARDDSIAGVIAVGTVAHPKLAVAESALAAGDDVGAIAAAQAEVQATRDALFAFREGRLETERLTRTPVFLLMLLPFAMYFWFMRKMEWEFGRPLLGALTYFVAFYALLFGRGYYFSLSMLNEDSAVVDWFAARTVDAIIALALAALVVGVLSRGAGAYRTVLNTFNAAFAIAALLWLQVDVFYWLFDFQWQWYLPDSTLGFKFYLDTVQTGAFMTKSPPVPTILILPLVALAACWLVERLPLGRAAQAEVAYE